MVVFPAFRDFEVSDDLFLSVWHEWVSRYGPKGINPAQAEMPVLAAHKTLAEQLAQGRFYSLDVMCRHMVPYSNTMQAHEAFRRRNKHLIEDIWVTNPSSGRKVIGVRLTSKASARLASLSQDDLDDARAILYDDSDGSATHKAVSTVARRSVSSKVRPPSFNPSSSLIADLVTWIQNDPYQAHHRGGPVGKPVKGWRSRLNAYFWDRPGIGVAANRAALAPLLSQAASLMALIAGNGARTANDDQKALQYANDVFAWGKVRQRGVTPQKVWDVLENVHHGRLVRRAAPMNSGWTKVAALASQSLPTSQHLVIWDSRVAHSIISRLDKLLNRPGQLPVPPGSPISKIGYVPGRGGTRLHFRGYTPGRWRNGYGSWPVQFAASEVLRLIVDDLNANYQLPDGQGSTRRWTVRDAEMVLFMDGY